MHKGFSLVELSIVLVILGLLTGGILAGQSLIRASELRAVSTEYSRFTAAMNTFRDKYFALPGDFTKATSFWTAAGTCPGDFGQGSTTTTCNGDGNGRYNINSMVTADPSDEFYRIWQHLAFAGLIEGSYIGVTTNNSYRWGVQPTNSPVSKISNGIWTIHTADNTFNVFSNTLFMTNYNNFLMLGGVDANYQPMNPLITAAEAWNIDTKMDDGRPARGKVMTGYAAQVVNTICTTADAGAGFGADLNVEYQLSEPAKACYLIFPNV